MYSKRLRRKLDAKKHPDKQQVFRISTSQKMHSPFEQRDTRYLEHLRDIMKLREAQEGSLLFRKKLLESNTRSNYQLELDRLMNEIHRPNLPHPTKEHMKKRIKELEELTFV